MSEITYNPKTTIEIFINNLKKSIEDIKQKTNKKQPNLMNKTLQSLEIPLLKLLLKNL